MRGDSTIALGAELITARARVNESIALAGDRAPRTNAAKRDLRFLQDRARRLFR